MATGAPFPDGISDQHVEKSRRVGRHASPLSIIVLGALVLVALSGLLGGSSNPTHVASTADVELRVNTPRIIRNGELFETRILVIPRRPISELVIGVTPTLWRDLTVNSMIPAAPEEKFENGAFRFSYGKAEVGKPLEIKVDSQINPALVMGDAGTVLVADGKRTLVELPVTMTVLP